MATVSIPTDVQSPFWTQVTTLDGTAYLLTFRYNVRESVYYLQVESADATVTFAQGIKLVSNFPLLRSIATPPGELMALAPANDDGPAALGELGPGQRVELLYIEAADLATLGLDGWRNPALFLNENGFFF